MNTEKLPARVTLLNLIRLAEQRAKVLENQTGKEEEIKKLRLVIAEYRTELQSAMMKVPNIPLPKGDRWMTVQEVAILFACDDETINRWCRGKRPTLKSAKVGARRRYIRKSHVNQLLRRKGIPELE